MPRSKLKSLPRGQTVMEILPLRVQRDRSQSMPLTIGTASLNGLREQGRAFMVMPPGRKRAAPRPGGCPVKGLSLNYAPKVFSCFRPASARSG